MQLNRRVKVCAVAFLVFCLGGFQGARAQSKAAIDVESSNVAFPLHERIRFLEAEQREIADDGWLPLEAHENGASVVRDLERQYRQNREQVRNLEYTVVESTTSFVEPRDEWETLIRVKDTRIGRLAGASMSNADMTMLMESRLAYASLEQGEPGADAPRRPLPLIQWIVASPSIFADISFSAGGDKRFDSEDGIRYTPIFPDHPRFTASVASAFTNEHPWRNLGLMGVGYAAFVGYGVSDTPLTSSQPLRDQIDRRDTLVRFTIVEYDESTEGRPLRYTSYVFEETTGQMLRRELIDFESPWFSQVRDWVYAEFSGDDGASVTLPTLYQETRNPDGVFRRDMGASFYPFIARQRAFDYHVVNGAGLDDEKWYTVAQLEEQTGLQFVPYDREPLSPRGHSANDADFVDGLKEEWVRRNRVAVEASGIEFEPGDAVIYD